VDTVYAAVGTKPVLFRLLLETAISGTDEAVPAEERDYVQAIRAEPTARRKIEIYAAAVRAVSQRRAPLHLVLRGAAAHAPELARIRDDIAARRANNMRLFAHNLMETGETRPDLHVDEIADVVWSTNSAEFYSLLVHDRGWPPERFEQWLADTWAASSSPTQHRVDERTGWFGLAHAACPHRSPDEALKRVPAPPAASSS